MINYIRAEQYLEKTIKLIELLIVKEPLTTKRALDNMIEDLRDILKSMNKADKSQALGRQKFWRLEKKSIRIAVKIFNLLYRV